MLRRCSLSRASTHTSCYAAVGSFGNVDDDDDGDGDDDGGEDKNDDDDDGDDDDVDMAYETKVSFLSLFMSPYKMFEKWRQPRAFQMPGT